MSWAGSKRLPLWLLVRKHQGSGYARRTGERLRRRSQTPAFWSRRNRSPGRSYRDLIIADDTADAEMVATDLLGQAEHGPSSPATLLTTSQSLAIRIEDEIQCQLKSLSTADVAGIAWKNCGVIILVDS